MAKGSDTPKFIGQLWRRLSPTGNTGDAIFRVAMFMIALSLVLIVAAMIVALAAHSTLSIRQFGFSFLSSSEWDPVKGRSGALACIFGTSVSSWVARFISV